MLCKGHDCFFCARMPAVGTQAQPVPSTQPGRWQPWAGLLWALLFLPPFLSLQSEFVKAAVESSAAEKHHVTALEVVR